MSSGRRCGVTAAALLLGGAALAGSGPRLAAPAALDCPRDRLTSYTGEVRGWTRGDVAIAVRIRTDWDTDETVTLPASDAASRFRLKGAAFTSADWARIAPVPGLRATAWVCSDGRTPPVIDWQPAAR